MFPRPQGHHKARSHGGDYLNAWKVDSTSTSRELTDHSTVMDKKFHIQINNREEDVQNLKTGFKHIGFKNCGIKRERRPLVPKPKLPSLIVKKVTNLGSLGIYGNSSETIPSLATEAFNEYKSRPSHRRLLNNKPKLNTSDLRSDSENKNNSLNQAESSGERDRSQENSVYELAVTRIGYWPNLKDILEENSTNNGVSSSRASNQNYSLEPTRRFYLSKKAPNGAINNRQTKPLKANFSLAPEKSKGKERSEESNIVRKEISLNLDTSYFQYPTISKGNQSFKDSSNQHDPHPNITSILNKINSGNNSRRRAQGKLDADTPKEEVEKFHKDLFMKLIFKGIGKNLQASHRDERFEKICEKKRIDFQAKLGVLTGPHKIVN